MPSAPLASAPAIGELTKKRLVDLLKRLRLFLAESDRIESLRAVSDTGNGDMAASPTHRHPDQQESEMSECANREREEVVMASQIVTAGKWQPLDTSTDASQPDASPESPATLEATADEVSEEEELARLTVNAGKVQPKPPPPAKPSPVPAKPNPVPANPNPVPAKPTKQTPKVVVSAQVRATVAKHQEWQLACAGAQQKLLADWTWQRALLLAMEKQIAVLTRPHCVNVREAPLPPR